MSVKASITIDGVAGLKPNQVRAAARVAMQAVGDYWIKHFQPRHYQANATALYGYAPRSATYRRRKRAFAEFAGVRSIGEDKPLVWSGRTRELAKAARTEAKAPSSTRAYADVIINAPALNFKGGVSKIDMRGEATRVLPAEAEVLAALFVGVFERELTRLGKAKRRLQAA